MFVIDGDHSFRNWLALSGAKLEVQAVAALRRTATAAATYAKLSKLYKSHTYALRSSIHATNVSPLHARVSANAKHALWVHDGTRAHEIKARRKQFLRFEQNGAIRFAKRVWHPGTKPRPFLTEAQDKAEPLFERLCREAATAAFR